MKGIMTKSIALGLIIALALMLVPHPQEAQNNACLLAIIACAAAQAHEEHVCGNSPRSADCWGQEFWLLSLAQSKMSSATNRALKRGDGKEDSLSSPNTAETLCCP